MKTSAEMQTESFISNITTTADTVFKIDCEAQQNSGFPIMKWMSCGVPVAGITDICANIQTTLTASGWESYEWSTGETGESITVNPGTTTTYYVTGTSGTSSTIDSVTVNVSHNIQVTPSIAPSPDYGTITASTYSQLCTNNSPITISISAETGYYITRIVVNGATVENFADENPLISNYTYTISNPQETNTWNVVAHLSNQYYITTTTVLNDEDETVITATGLVTPNNGNLVITAFNDTTVYFHETARYAIEEVFVNDASYGAIDSFEFNNITEHYDIKIVYADDCGIAKLPYTEGFEDYATGASATFPDCYERVTSVSDRPYVYAGYAKTGSKSLYFYNSSPTTYNMIVFPMLKVENVDITDLRVRFHARTSNTGAIIEVGVMTNALDANTFVPCDTARFSKTNEYSLYTTYLNNYQNEGKFIAFRFTTSASAYMDDVTIDLAPDCIEPEGLTVSNIGGRTAQINWIASAGNPDYYDLEIIETATEYSVIQENLYGETSYLAEGLDPNTPYTVKLYSVCEDGAVYSPLVTTTFNTLNTTDCATPNLFKASNVTAYTADLSWVKDGLHDDYYIEYKTASAIVWENETVYSDNSLELSNLTPASTYTARIRSICDDDENSAWSTITFNTPCAPVLSMPVIEYFDNTPGGSSSNGLLPNCWMNNVDNATNRPYVATYTSATHADIISPYGALDFHYAPNTTNIAILPPIDLSEKGESLRDLQVNFWAKARSATAGSFILGIMNDPNDRNTFFPIDTMTFTAAETWSEFAIPLGAYEGNGQYIAFAWKNAGSYSALLDNLYIDYIPTCTRPESLTMDSVTAREVYFSWVDEVNASWEAVCVSSNDDLNWTNAVPVSGLTGEFSNLSPNTRYTLYLRADCGSDSYSMPRSFTFTTTCAPIMVSDLPYTENFDYYGTGSYIFPTCWTRASQTSTTNPYISTTNYNSSPASMYFSGTATAYVSAVTEKFDMQVNTLQMEFVFRSGSLNMPITIGVMTNPNDPTSFDTITSVFASKTNTWEKHTVYLNNYQGTGQYIAFRTIGASVVYLDDVEIKLAPACIPIQNLTVSNQTNSSADFTWVGPENATSYEIEVGLPGFTPGDGTAIVTDDTEDEFYDIALGELSEATAYVFAVRSVCGDDDGESTWVTLDFGTKADETIYGDGIWRGYVYKSPNPDVPANRFDTYLGMITEDTIFSRTTSGAWTGNAPVWVGTPPSDYFAVRYKMSYDFPCGYYTFTFTGINDAVRFSTDGGQTWMRLCVGNNCGEAYGWNTTSYVNGNYTGSAYLDGPSDLVIEFFEATGNATCAFSFAPSAVAITTSNPTPNSIDLNFLGGDEWNVIVSTSAQTDLGNPTNVVNSGNNVIANPYTIPSLTPETTYYIYAQVTCDTLWGSTTASTVSTCPKPTGLTVTGIGADTATLSWASLGMSSWNLKVSTTALTDLDTETGDFFDGPVSTNSYSLVGLASTTLYYCYVQSSCGSPWSDGMTFRTLQIPAELPYTCDFEDPLTNSGWEFNNGTQTNKWVNGTAVNNGGSGSLYISNDNGTTCAYTHATSFVYAYRDFNVASDGTYSISFDWKCNGEGNYDLLRAFLVPTTANLTAGNDNGMTGNTNNTPAGWTDLTNGKMNLSTSWNSFNNENVALTSGTHRLVFFWKNDGSVGTQPPASVDNVDIRKNSCPRVTNIHTTAVTASSADLAWTAGDAETEWSVKIVPAGANHNTYTETTVTTASYSATTLSDGTSIGSNTSYDCWVQANCGTDDNSIWIKYTFKTDCGVGNMAGMGYSEGAGSIPWVENFNTYTNAYKLAQDWAGKGQSLPDCWTNVTNVGADSGIP
ncbi:fibronectin type III domain-containing protein, partial [Bacteroidales bacterium OttesenSCG-928-E04]|nr:fibronectin type III domain-containing protein [Bacteroidales bacterium OttesenSCG-928-E04]